jgi:hypothetical protein
VVLGAKLCSKPYQRKAAVTGLRGAGARYSTGASAGEGHPPEEQVHPRVRQPVTGLRGQRVRASLPPAGKTGYQFLLYILKSIVENEINYTKS